MISGYCTWLDTYLPPTYYTFELGKDIFKRKTKKCADDAYSGVYVTGKAADNSELTPVQVAVANYAYWYLPGKKLKHIAAPSSVDSQAELQWYAEQQAAAMSNAGIGEEFTGPLRPQLLVGDVAEIDNGDGTAMMLGIITQVKHTMGASGFTTDISVDSGGVVTTTDGTVRTRTSGTYGYNRRQHMVDIMRKVAGK